MDKKKDFLLEDAFEKMENIIEELEQPEISLEDSFKLYQNGMNLLKKCNDEIDKIEKKVMSINENGESNEFQ